MNSSSPNDINSDAPLISAEQDRLGRLPFARGVAKLIRDLPKGAGIVVGIYGPWGDGKTSVLNLIRSDLKDSSSIVVQAFDPWRLTSEDALLRGFLLNLASAINATLSTRSERVTKKAGIVARWIQWGWSLISWMLLSRDPLQLLLQQVQDAATKADAIALETLRSRLMSALAQSAKRILVLVDDIDRLDHDETHLVFRLVKSCAALPNVCYLLAFDDAAVSKTLASRFGDDISSGRAFLEKIVQIPLRLPVAAREDLRSLCVEEIERVLSAANCHPSQDELGRFAAAFDRGTSVRLSSPRIAKRLRNCLQFALPLLTEETNTTDLLLVETVRAFYPEVYEVLRLHHIEFAGASDKRGQAGREDSWPISSLKQVLQNLNPHERQGAKDLVEELFPRVCSELGGSRFGSDWLPRWAQFKRICSPEYVRRYFTYGVPLGDVADREVSELVEFAHRGKLEAVASWLDRFLTLPTAARVIEKLRSVEGSVSEECALFLAPLIAERAYRLPNPQALFDFATPASQAAILISHLLKRIGDPSRRVSIACSVVQRADPLWFGAECLRWMRVSEDETHNVLSKNDISIVRRSFMVRVHAASEAGMPLFDPDAHQVASVLYEWWRAEGREPVQAHLIETFKRDPGEVARFLQSQAPLTWGANSASPAVGSIDGDILRNIRLIIDLEILADWVRRSCRGDFDNPSQKVDGFASVEQRLAEQFMSALQRWSAQPEAAQEDSTAQGRDESE